MGGERPPGPDGGVGGEDVVGHLEPGLVTGLLIIVAVMVAGPVLPQPVLSSLHHRLSVTPLTFHTQLMLSGGPVQTCPRVSQPAPWSDIVC